MGMQPSTIFFATFVLVLAGVGGCASRLTNDDKAYQTISADPNRDTAAAGKKHEKALKIIARASDPAFYQCSCVAKTLCNTHKAEKLLQEALVDDVRYGPAHNTLGLLYFHQRRLYLAAWEFEFAANLMPSRPEPLNNLGLVYEEGRQYDLAIESYSQAVSLAPNNALFLGNLLRTQLKLGTELSEVRPGLQHLLVIDSRPEWIAWAEDMLGSNPQAGSLPSPQAESLPAPNGSLRLETPSLVQADLGIGGILSK